MESKDTRNELLDHGEPDKSEPVPAEELPISTHERLLGVDITIHARAMHNEIYRGSHPGGLSAEPDIRAVGSGRRGVGYRERAYIARWARNSLLKGAKACGSDE